MIKELQEEVLRLTDKVAQQEETIERITEINKHNYELLLHLIARLRDRK